MKKRRIQLVAGRTYTVSLPKDWVRKQGIKERDEVAVLEKGDGTLLVTASDKIVSRLENAKFCIEDYPENLDDVLYTYYNIGVQEIQVCSKGPMSKENRAVIRKCVSAMSGTEITHEDPENMTIKIFLDRAKVDIHQVLYRITLLIDHSLTQLESGVDHNEIRLNEDEIDRLYNLANNMITLSLKNSEILKSSCILNLSLVPSYFLLAKKLENIGDVVISLSTNESNIPEGLLKNVSQELQRAIKYLMGKKNGLFQKSSLVNEILSEEKSIECKLLLRYLKDVQETVVNISFLQQLIEQGKL